MARKGQSENVSREYQTAIHEAGHAVVGLRLDMKLRRKAVTIVPDVKRETLGCTHVHWMFNRAVLLDAIGDSDRNYPKYFLRAIRYAITVYAGGLAVEEYLSIEKPLVGCGQDYRNADDILSRFEGGESLQALLDYVAIKARELLKNRLIRMQVHALADALIERRQLTGDDVNEVLNDVIDAECRKAPKAHRGTHAD